MAYPTSVTQFQGPGARGLVANAETRNLIARSRADNNSVALGFGEPVYRVPAGGAGNEQCSALAAAGDFLGITRRMGTLDPINPVVDIFAQNDEVPILDEGTIWVDTAKAVTAGAVANFDTVARQWTDAAIAGNVIDVPDCEFDTSTSAAGQAIVRVRRKTKA